MERLNQFRIIVFLFFGSIHTDAFAQEKLLDLNDSLFNIPIVFQDEDSVDFSLKQLKAHAALVTMAYTSCKMTCPLTVKKLLKVEKEYLSKKIEKEIVIITLDPTGDTPERLKQYYRKRFGILSKKWHFLRANSKDTHLIADFLKIKFEEIDDHIRHDNRFVLINDEGKVTKRIDGWDSSLDEFL